MGTLTVLIGPNNAGKSQTLRDILNLNSQGAGIVLESVEMSWPATFADFLEEFSIEYNAHEWWIGPRSDPALLRTGIDSSRWEKGGWRESYVQDYDLLPHRVRLFTVAERLSITNQSGGMNLFHPEPRTLLQRFFLAQRELEPQLNALLGPLFGLQAHADLSSTVELHLRVSPTIPSVEGLGPVEHAAAMGAITTATAQGDGIRSFMGVVMALLLERGKVLLIDEADVFLHPAQARELGRWIARYVHETPNQVVLATHNENLLMGLLLGAGEKSLSVLRLERTAPDTTRVTHIDPDLLRRVRLTPRLSSQAFFHALFQNGVVVVEAPADRAVYETVARSDRESNIVFMHAENKQTLKDLAAPLRASNVPAAVIADFDILRNEAEFSALVHDLTSYEQAEALVRRRREILVGAHGDPGPMEDPLAGFNSVREWLNAPERPAEVLAQGPSWLRNRLVEKAKPSGYWEQLKSGGVGALPEERRADANAFLEECSVIGLFIVPVGELEDWMGVEKGKEAPGEMLEAIHAGKCPEQLRAFVSKVLDSLTPQPAAGAGDRDTSGDPCAA